MNRIGRYQRQLSNTLWATRQGVLGRRPSVLFLTHQNHICESQIYPFYFFRSRLLKELNFDFREIALADYERSLTTRKYRAEIVFLQPWFTIQPDRLRFLLERIRNDNPEAMVVFLDSFAPLDLRLAEIVNPYIDVYVKKSVFRDRSRYGEVTMGDTNLADYFGRLFELEHSPTRFHIPPDFIAKLLVGPGFATAPYMLPTFIRSKETANRARPIDLHARLGGSGDSWYGKMREHAKAAVNGITGLHVATEGLVSQRQYIKELRASKLCFSPFGFGEVCWRDYEAAMYGALLIKPDMRHIETHPDIFDAFETYIPVRWDLSDLEEEVRYYLKHDDERIAIANSAYKAVRNYFRDGGFLKHVRSITAVSPNREQLIFAGETR